MEAVLVQELVSAKIRRDAWKAAKIAAAEDEINISDILSDAVEQYLERRKKVRTK